MSQQKLQVLLAIDDVELQNQLVSYLQQTHSYDADVVTDDGAALSYLEQNHDYCPVMLIDDSFGAEPGQTPEPLGVTLTKEIKARYPEIATILFTDNGLGLGLAALRAGAYRYLAKPVNLEELGITIQMAAEHSWLRGIAREKKILERLMISSTALLSGGSRSGVLDVILCGVQAIGYDRIRLYLLSEDSSVLIGQAQVGMDVEFVGFEFPMADNFHVQTLLSDPRPQVFERRDNEQLPYDKQLAKEEVNQWVCVPLLLGGEFIGMLSADNKFSQRPIVGAELGPVALFAAQAAAAIENSRLRDEGQKATQKAEHRARHLEVLNQINGHIAAALNLNEMLQVTLREGLRAINTDEGSITLVNPTTNELEFKAWFVEGEFVADKPHRKFALGEGIAGHVAIAGEAYNCPDVSKDTHFVESFTGRSLCSLLSVPIISHGRVLGTINADSQIPNFFTTDDEKFLSALANHVAIVIETHRLRDISKILSTLTLDEVLAKVVENACILMGAESSSIFLLDKKSGDPAQAVKFPSSRKGSLSPRRNGLTRLIASSGEPIIIPDAQQDPRVKQSTKGRGVKSILGVPLKIQTKGADTSVVVIIGALFITVVQEREFSDRDLELVQNLAGQAAIAIENAQLYKEVAEERDLSERMASRLLALHRVSQMLQSELDLPHLLDLISELTVKLLDTDSAGILLLDERKECLTFQGSYKLSRKVVEGTCDQIGQSIAGRVVESGRPIIANDIPNDSRLDNPAADGERWLAIISTPLLAGGEVIGTLDAHSKSERHAFNEEDLRILTMMTTQAAIAIQNAKLFAQTSRRSKALEALHRTALELTSYRQVPKLIRSILERAVELLRAKGGRLYSLDEANSEFTLVGAFRSPEDLVDLTLELGDSVVGRVIKTNAPLFVSDYRNWPYRIREYDPYNFTAVAGAPITWQGRIWGAITVHDDVEGRSFSEEDLNLLSHFGNLAAVALENAELVIRDTDKLRRLEQLTQAYSEILGNLGGMSLDERLNLIAKHATEILEAEACSILQVKRPNFLSFEASYGYREEALKGREFAIRSGPRSGLTGHIAYQSKLFNAYGEDLNNHFAVRGEEQPYVVSGRCYSLLVIPLKKESEHKEELVGLLRMDNKKDGNRQIGPMVGFTQEDEWILSLFADATVVAIEGAELVAQLRQQKDHLMRLNEITDRRGQLLTALDEASRQIRAEKETFKLLQEVVRLAAKLVGCTSGGLYLNRPQLKELQLHITYELAPELIGNRLLHSEGIGGLVARTGKCQIVYDYSDWPDHENFFEAYRFKTVVGVPLTQAGEVEAVLFVVDRTGLGRFAQPDLDILERFAAQASIALQTSRLMSQEQRTFKQLVVFHKISDYIQAAGDLDKVLHAVLTGVTAGYGLSFNRAALLLLDEKRENLIGRMGIGHLDQVKARMDWERDHREGLFDFGRYLQLLERGDLSPTPMHIRIRGLQLSVRSADPDIFSQVILEGDYTLVTRDNLDKLPGSFVKAFEPDLPFIVAPLLARDQVIGLLVADNKFTHSPITSEDVESLLTFANSAAIAIDNTQLFYEAKVAEKRLRSFYEASNTLISSSDPEQILRDIVEQARVAADASEVSIILIDQMEKARYLITVGTNQQANISDVLRPNGLTIGVMRTGKLEIIENADNQRDLVNPTIFRRGIAAALYLPVSLEGKRIGVMWVHYSQPRHFRESEIEALQLYVNQAAIAYDSARRIKKLEYMHRAAEALAGVAELPRVLEQIVQSAREVLQADAAVIWSYDTIRGQFMPERSVAAGVPADWLEESLKAQPQRGGTAYTVMKKGWIGVMDVNDQQKYGFLSASTRHLLGQIKVQSFQGIALTVGEETLGVLYVNYDRPRSFSEEEQETAQIFANHAVLALKKAKLLDQVDKARSAAHVVAKVTALEKLDDALDLVAEGMVQAVKCDAVTVYVYDQDKDRLRHPATMIDVRYPERTFRIPEIAKASIVFEMLKRDRSYIVENISTDSLFKNSRFAADEHVASCVSIPLKVGDEKVGVMFVNYRRVHRFTTDELTNIEGFAHQAAVAIRNAQLYDQLQQRARVLHTLYEAGRAVTGSLDLNDILSAIAEQAWKLISSDSKKARFSHLALADGNKLRFEAAYPPEHLPGLQKNIGDIDLEYNKPIGVAGRAVKTGQSQLVGDVTQDSDYIEYDSEIHSELTVPIEVGEEVIGVINIEHPDHNAFDEKDQQALEALSAQAGIAIQNAQQYRDLERTKGLLAARTAVAWTGMVSATWGHAIKNNARTIKDLVKHLYDDLDAGAPTEKLKERLAYIDSMVDKIRHRKQVTAPLSAEEGIELINVNNLMMEWIEQIWWDQEPYKAVEYELNLTSQAEPMVKANAKWLKLALDTLVENAVKAMTTSTLKELDIATEIADSNVEISISDTGGGIPLDRYPRLFKEVIKDSEDGAGIGLLLVQMIVQVYGGDIRIGSTNSSGTTIVICLPIEG